MKKWMAAALMLGLMGLAGAAQAQRGEGWGPPPGGPGGRGKGPDRSAILKEAGLTDAQIAQIREIRDATQREVIPLRSEAQLAMMDIRKAMEADTPNEAEVMSAVERANAIQLKIRKAQISGVLKVRAVAGPEAWSAIKEETHEWFEQRRERMRERRDEGWQGGGPQDDRPRRRSGPPEDRPRGPQGSDDPEGPPPWEVESEI